MGQNESLDKETLENDKLIKDHEYDGIMELDNDMPAWLWAVFALTIVFSVIYVLRFHMMGGKTQMEEYADELAEAKAQSSSGGEVNAEDFYVMLEGEEDLAVGKDIYAKNCIACHGGVGEGTPIGPNLTDKYWKNGGSFEEVYKAIADGVPNTAMMSWKNQLSPKKTQQVTSYTMSLVGSNPPNAKEPEGELVE